MKTAKRTLYLDTKKIMQLTKVLESKRGTKLKKKVISSSNRGAHHNNIIHIN
jgi:hypothetical protein